MPKAPPDRYFCPECGHERTGWLGYCPACRARTPLVKAPPAAPATAVSAGKGTWRGAAAAFGGNEGGPTPWKEVAADLGPRPSSGIGELDRVLGGGVAPGSAVLVAGEPGAGKSTLLLQVAAAAAREGAPVLYVSGEESEQQLKIRGDRLGVSPESLFLYSATEVPKILEAAEKLKPRLVVLDSVQCVYSPGITGAPGTITQVREAASALVLYGKRTTTPIYLVGQVNKDGGVAGPRALEHIVDTVLYFEGDRRESHRLLRAVKNRFGPAGELGVFEMTDRGLVPVENPSQLFLSGDAAPKPGSAVVCTLEGQRPILAEVQALLAESPLAYPRRVTVGFDGGRLSVLLAVLESNGAGGLARSDVYVSVTGGLAVTEPAADLGLLAAVVSRRKGRALPEGAVFLGEVGLSGEIRPVRQAALRLKEAYRLGFRRALLNPGKLRRAERPKGIEILPVTRLDGALAASF